MSGRVEAGLLKPKERTSRLLRLAFGALDRFYLLRFDRLVGLLSPLVLARRISSSRCGWNSQWSVAR